MKGCLLLIIGVIVGIVVLAFVQMFVAKPAAQPAPPPATYDLEIVFRNEFLTRMLKTQLGQAGKGLTIDRVSVLGQADQTLLIVGTASTPSVNVSVPIRVILRPSVAGNRISVQVVRAEFGTLALPGQLFSQIQGPINDEINRSLATAPYRIVKVSTTGDGLVVDVVISQ